MNGSLRVFSTFFIVNESLWRHFRGQRSIPRSSCSPAPVRPPTMYSYIPSHPQLMSRNPSPGISKTRPKCPLNASPSEARFHRPKRTVCRCRAFQVQVYPARMRRGGGKGSSDRAGLVLQLKGLFRRLTGELKTPYLSCSCKSGRKVLRDILQIQAHNRLSLITVVVVTRPPMHELTRL
jgi:hypothetical protein